jgi:hypothetical protein
MALRRIREISSSGVVMDEWCAGEWRGNRRWLVLLRGLRSTSATAGTLFKQ